MQSNARHGIWLMIATTAVLAVLDAISRHLAGEYNVYMVVMIRYWFFALFAIALVSRQPGGIRTALATRQPMLHAFRGVILVLEILTTIAAFVVLGLVETHAIFACSPLMIAALSGPVLGERVGWRRWAAIGVGLVGILIILRPGSTVFSPYALVPLGAATMWAVYGLMTRYVAREDTSMTSFFWAGTVGAIAATAIGIWHWEPMRGSDWAWTIALCALASLAHYLLIRAYEVAEASVVQPFAYFQLVFVSILAFAVFNETVEWQVLLGAAIVVGAGIFTFLRERASAGAKAR